MTTQAHFGFQPVDEGSRQGMVNEVFARVAPRYDVMNDVMSLGLHRLWKRRMIAQLRLGASMKVLDLAAGTGDITRLMKAAQPDVDITMTDINPAMLREGKARLMDENIRDVRFATANAETLPFESMQFDRTTIAFGIRNVTHIDAALAEIHRVLKPGGKFVCLEFSRLALPLLAPLYDAYSLKIIPKLGGLIAGDEASYRYLVESIRQFPHQEAFAKILASTGFSQVKYTNLSGGIVAIHSGVKP